MHSNEEFWKIFIDVQKIEKFDGNTWRTSKNHVRGEVFNDRIYGGQLVAQSYIIAKSLFPGKYLSKIETNFIGPGTALEVMDYHVENLPNNLTKIIVKQNGKFISKSFLRFDEVPHSLIENVHVDENLQTNIQHPTSYCEMEELLNNPDINNYPKEHKLFIESVCSLKFFENVGIVGVG
uniref:Uncharacterized protein n=1 Tax=Acrobeloides nanus TaxID=290746 RepID=A0A914ED73_9BILA